MTSFLRSREAVLMALLLVLGIVASILEPRFMSIRSQTLLASHMWELAIIAIPMLLIVMSGGIDLSVGSMVALCAVTFGLLVERGLSPAGAMAIALLVGAMLGAANGWFIAKLRVHPLIITLASMAAFRGIAEGISTARPLSGYPETFLALSQGSLAGIPYPALIFLAVAGFAWIVLDRTVFGRWIIAMGTQENVAVFSGIPVGRAKAILYAGCGLACAIAAMVLVSRNNTAKADLGMGMELEAITVVVLGGASIEGGKGRILGLVLGLLLIHELREFVSWHWKQNEFNMIVIGALLILAVALEHLLAARRRNAKSHALA